MRVCHVNLASGFSGGERQTLEMIKQQLKLGIELVVVANPKSQLFYEVQQLDCDLIPAKRFWNAQLRTNKKPFDLVHVHDGKAVHWAYIQYKIYSTSYIITRRIDNPLKKKSRRQYQNASVLIGLSTIICERLKEMCPNSRIEKIPSSPVSYPVNQVRVNEIKAQFLGKFLIIQAANMYEHKGFDVSIKAASILSKLNPNIQFVFLGDGPLKSSLEEQARLLPNVYFTGKQSNMGDWFASADLMIHPAYSEGLGSVILEAMNSNVPIIATRVGGIPDIIEDSKNGLLVESGDARSLAEKINFLCENEQIRNKIKNNISNSLDRFKIEYTSEKYINIYRELWNF